MTTAPCYSRLLLALCLIISSTSYAALNTTIKIKKQQYRQLSHKIEKLQRHLAESKNKHVTLSHELSSSKRTIINMSKKLHQINHTLRQQHAILTTLKTEQMKQNNNLQQQQDLLSRQIQAAYQLGQFKFIKLLLNQQNPNHLMRILTYYRYINQARLQVMQQINQTLASIGQRQLLIRHHTTALQHLLTQKKAKRLQLQTEKAYRQHVLAQLDNKIKSSQSQLQQLLADKQGLEQVIHQLKTTVKKSNDQYLPFARMHHRLSWPTAGRITHRFGSNIGNSSIQSNGIFIHAPQGQAVTAIYTGRVVFAKRLKGFGLLLIINHGGGYMSLYAHNHSLYKKSGDNVAAGELIARVGRSSINPENGLYFEVRYKGKPLNPNKWCHSAHG